MLAAVIDKVALRVLGKKPKTSDNLAAAIGAQEDAISAARAKIETANLARTRAVEEDDAAEHRKADEDIAEAGREIERREHAIKALQAAHAERVDGEAREALRKDVAALAQDGVDLRKRIETDYSPAAETIATLVADIAAFQARQKALVARGKKLGEAVLMSDPEDFRETPVKKEWSASWPAPEGGYRISGSVEDAPWGSIKWESGEPVSKRPDVEIRHSRVVSGGTPASLVESVGDLPKLKKDEGFFHIAYKVEPSIYVSLADRLRAQ